MDRCCILPFPGASWKNLISRLKPVLLKGHYATQMVSVSAAPACNPATPPSPAGVFTPAASVVLGHAGASVEIKDWDRSGDHASSVSLFGWCVSRTGRPLRVEFHLQGMPLASAPLHIPRPDVVAALGSPDTPLHCGFYLRLSKLVLPPGAALEVVMAEEREDGRALVPLGILAGLPPPRLAPGYAERHQPLLLLGLGRSGTTYAMRLLAGHPGILVTGGHPYEMRPPVWLWHAAQVMSAPGADASMHPDGFESRDADRLGYNPYRSRDWEDAAGPPAVMRWQEESLPAAAIEFCKRQVDEFVQCCTAARRVTPRFVAQKMLVSLTRHFVRNIYPGARDVFLVRDFRDVWLSARSFNRKRGGASFGREGFASDLDWLRGLAFSTRQLRLAHLAAGPDALTLRYEELMRDPAPALTRVLAGLGLDAAPDLVRRLVAAAGAGDRDAEQHRTSEPGGDVERWRTEMTPEEMAAAADAFGEDLRYFGYDA